MKGEHLPVQDHTARYCPGSRLAENGKPAPVAFHLRKGEPYLSVEWLEYPGQPGRLDEIRAVIEILSKKLRLGSSARLAVLGVGAVCDHVRKETGYSIRVCEHINLIMRSPNEIIVHRLKTLSKARSAVY